MNEAEIFQEASANERIAALAYQIYLERGSPDGEHLEHWLEAERRLAAEGQPDVGSKIVSCIQSA